MTEPTPQTTHTRDEAVLKAAQEIRECMEMNCLGITTVHISKLAEWRNLLSRLASAPAPASGGVDAGWQKMPQGFWKRDGASVRVKFGRTGTAYRVTFDDGGTFNAASLEEAKSYADNRLASLSPAETPAEPDMRRVCEALGFDPTNHHNAAKCPYCTPAATPVSEAEPGEGMAEMGEIARIVSEWRHGPMLSPEALRQIAALAKPSSPAGGDVREALARLVKEHEEADYESGPSQEAWNAAYAALSQPTSAGRGE